MIQYWNIMTHRSGLQPVKNLTSLIENSVTEYFFLFQIPTDLHSYNSNEAENYNHHLLGSNFYSLFASVSFAFGRLYSNYITLH